MNTREISLPKRHHREYDVIRVESIDRVYFEKLCPFECTVLFYFAQFGTHILKFQRFLANSFRNNDFVQSLTSNAVFSKHESLAAVAKFAPRENNEE